MTESNWQTHKVSKARFLLRGRKRRTKWQVRQWLPQRVRHNSLRNKAKCGSSVWDQQKGRLRQEGHSDGATSQSGWLWGPGEAGNLWTHTQGRCLCTSCVSLQAAISGIWRFVTFVTFSPQKKTRRWRDGTTGAEPVPGVDGGESQATSCSTQLPPCLAVSYKRL